jgi:hypothetical protein
MTNEKLKPIVDWKVSHHPLFQKLLIMKNTMITQN